MTDLILKRAYRLALLTDLKKAKRDHKPVAALRKALTLVTAELAMMEARG